MEDLLWLGLDWDEGPSAAVGERVPDGGVEAMKGEGETGAFGPYTQSSRSRRYEEVISQLQGRGLLYPCYCTRKELHTLASAPHLGDEGHPYPGTCRTLADSQRRALARAGRRSSLRLNTELAAELLGEKRGTPLVLRFTDAVLGEQALSLDECGGDFVLRRSDGVFAYQLAVTVDDADMHISEVLRGEDLLPSTPRQLLLFRLMGAAPPDYVHVPLLYDAGGERLAKRHKSLELAALRHAGLRPQEVLSYLGNLAACLDSPASPGESRQALLQRMIVGFSPRKLRGCKLTVNMDATGMITGIRLP
jgi:glutamyl-tRNA synthetase